MSEVRTRRSRDARRGTAATRMSSLTRLCTLVGIAGPISYVVFVTLLGLAWAGYDPVRQTQSELGAVDAPHGPLMNVAGFMGLGITILAFVAAFVRIVRASPWKLLAAAALIVAGLGMVTVGFFPCDAGCLDVTRTSELHSTFSMPGAIGLPVALTLSAMAFRRDGRFGTAWQVGSLWLGLLALSSGPIVAADLLPDAAGLLQRGAMWAPILWISAVSARLWVIAEPATRSSVS